MPARLIDVRGLVIHCSASPFGDAQLIGKWHRERGWSQIGYHAVILNGRRAAGAKYNRAEDGLIELGRPLDLAGAHCEKRGINIHTLSVCLVGNPGRPTPEAMPGGKLYSTMPYITMRQWFSLVHWLEETCQRNHLDPLAWYRMPQDVCHYPVITQHSELDPRKPLCASLRMAVVRHAIAQRLRLTV